MANGSLKSASWDAAELLLQKADRLDQHARTRLHDALARSNEALSPLRDPLGLNLGTHRWLVADREESYSDWLAWILQGIGNPAEILPLFAFYEKATSDLLGQVEKVGREGWSEYGRTDIELRFGDRGLLVVEVKTKPPTDLRSQLEKYSKRLDEQRVQVKLKSLLAKEKPSDEELEGFTFTSWRTLCQRLRNYANTVKHSDLLRATAILIFCGAVEQNLLGLSARPGRFRAAPTVDYLLGWQ